jgi:hypothetical protein
MRQAMPRWYWLIVLVLLASCVDPMERPGTWNISTSHSNDANLRVMVANPQDLVKGMGQNTSAGAEAAPPVARLLDGKRYPLPVENTSSISSVPEPLPQGPANPSPNQ